MFNFRLHVEIKLSIQSNFASGSRLMGIIRIHLMIYFLHSQKKQLTPLYIII